MKISESVERIDGTMANVYVARHEGKVLLIDTGMKSSARKIMDFLDQRGEKPDAILITHYHPDHIGGLSQLVEKYNSPVYANHREVEVIKGEKRVQATKSMLSKMVNVVSKSAPVQDVESFDKMPYAWMKPVETLGHTPGSTSFLFEPESMLFVGDAVTVKNGKTSVNKQFTLDLAEAEKSQEKILSMKGITILPGHGEPLKIQ